MNNKFEKVFEFLKSHDLGKACYLILRTIAVVGSMQADKIRPWSKSCASSVIKDKNERTIITSRDSLDSAFSLLIDKHLIQITDKNTIMIIRDHLVDNPAYGPVERIPNAGEVDLTLQGGILWDQIDQQLRDRNDMYIIYDDKSEFSSYFICYSIHQSNAIKMLHERCLEPDQPTLTFLDGPRHIGKWRDRWWRPHFANGYRLDAWMVSVQQGEGSSPSPSICKRFPT